MTFKERLQIEYQENINSRCVAGCMYCPETYGYEAQSYCENSCVKCWNREIPVDDFKAGDKVKLRDGLVVGKKYDGITFRGGMRFKKEKEVQYVSSELLPLIDGLFYSPVMLQKVGESEEKKMKFKVGDRVRAIRGKNIEKLRGLPVGGVGIISCINKKYAYPYRVAFSSDNYWNYPEDMLEKVEFSIEDLKDGNMIKTRNGNIFLWLLGRPRSLNYSLDHMKNNLKNGIKEDFDIIEVRDASNLIFTGIKDLFNNYKNLTIIWKEEELPKTKDVSLDEINALLKEKYPDIDKFNLPIEKED